MERMHLLINNYDMTQNYGVCICKGTIENLLAYPEFKKLKSNDWFEHDCVEYDLSAPKFKNKNAVLNLQSRSNAWNLINDIVYGGDGYGSISVPQIELSFSKVRYNRGTKSNVFEGLYEYSLEFIIDDVPFASYTPSQIVTANPTEPITMDSVNLASYGIKVLNGWKGEMAKMPQLKQPMTRDIEIENSVICDHYAHNGSMYYSDMSFDCLISGGTSQQVIEKYRRFFYALTRPNKRAFTFSSNDCMVQYGFYKNVKVTEFINGNRAWLRFTLTLTAQES